MFKSRSIEERFWEKVNKDGGVSDHAPSLGKCWLWEGFLDSDGYGKIKKGGCTHKKITAHRLSLTLSGVKLKKNLVVDHLCRNRRCVNPKHLEQVTWGENVYRGFNPMAMNARKTHCPKGHEYDKLNTYINPKGQRICRKCTAMHQRAYKARLRRESGQ